MFNKYSFVSTKSAMYDIFRRYLNIKISLRPIARGRKVDAVASARRRRVDATQVHGRCSTDAPAGARTRTPDAKCPRLGRGFDAVFVKLFLGSTVCIFYKFMPTQNAVNCHLGYTRPRRMANTKKERVSNYVDYYK